jgi:uncharacterized membrane protein
MAGGAVSWLFVAGVAALTGVGVWLGRFQRFNSWDVLFRPVKLYHGIGSEAVDPLRSRASLAFAALFATFLFITYLMLCALTHLRRVQPPASPPGPDSAKTSNPRVVMPVSAISG